MPVYVGRLANCSISRHNNPITYCLRYSLFTTTPPPSHLQHLDDTTLPQGPEVHRERVGFLADLHDADRSNRPRENRHSSIPTTSAVAATEAIHACVLCQGFETCLSWLKTKRLHNPFKTVPTFFGTNYLDLVLGPMLRYGR